MARTATTGFDAGALERLAQRRDRLDQDREQVGEQIAEQLRQGKAIGLSVTTLAGLARLTRSHASKIIHHGNGRPHGTA